MSSMVLAGGTSEISTNSKIPRIAEDRSCDPTAFHPVKGKVERMTFEGFAQLVFAAIIWIGQL